MTATDKLTSHQGHMTNVVGASVTMIQQTAEVTRYAVRAHQDRSAHTVSVYTKPLPIMLCSCRMARYEGQCKHLVAVAAHATT